MRASIAWSLVLSVLASGFTPSRNTAITSFSEAKRLAAKVFEGYEETLYCGCRYDGRTIDRKSCGYQPERPSKRAQRLEWEHVVPAHAFGQSFRAWREGHPACVDRRGRAFEGRNCARKVELEFRLMESDLYNLQPAIGALNSKRSNFSMAMIAGESREFGACDFEVENRKIEPRPEVRGDIARTYQYMNSAYPGRGVISRENRKLFESWSKEDPVDAGECERTRRIAKLQGNRNDVVARACESAGL